MKTVRRLLDPETPARIPPKSCALAIMTKAPRAGHVKTRLVPPLTPQEAATLNTCFLRDTANAISTAAHIGNEDGEKGYGVAVYTPVGSEELYLEIVPPEFGLIPQRGQGFGDRLYAAAEDLFKCGFDAVCLIDSDSPTVRPGIFAQAAQFLHLPGDRIVIGPSDDGGYYLIGLKKPHREMFERIDWSTEQVFDQTMERAAEIGSEVRLLPTCYDVDGSASLHRLCDELLSQNSRNDVAPETRKFLKEIIARDGRDRIWPV